MISKDTLKKYKDVIEFFNLDTNHLRDVVYSIVMIDYIRGTNRRELDVDKLCSNNNDIWNEFKSFIGLGSSINNCENLPYVQMLRIMCDSLIICLKENGNLNDSFLLTSECSIKVSSSLGLQLQSKGYCSESECLEVIDNLHGLVVSDVPNEFGWYRDLELKLEKMSEHLNKLNNNVNLGNLLKPQLGRLAVPIETKYLKKCSSESFWDAYESLDDFKCVVYDNIMYTLELRVITELRNKFQVDKVKGNSALNKLVRAVPDAMFGTCSMINCVPRIETLSRFPSYARVKIDRLFMSSKVFNIEDLDNIFICLCFCLSKKVLNIDEEFNFLKGLESEGY